MRRPMSSAKGFRSRGRGPSGRVAKAAALSYWVGRVPGVSAAIATASFVLSIAYDYGYLHAVGLSLGEVPTTISDHTTTALRWSPAVSVFVLGMLAAAYEGIVESQAAHRQPAAPAIAPVWGHIDSVASKAWAREIPIAAVAVLMAAVPCRWLGWRMPVWVVAASLAVAWMTLGPRSTLWRYLPSQIKLVAYVAPPVVVLVTAIGFYSGLQDLRGRPLRMRWNSAASPGMR